MSKESPGEKLLLPDLAINSGDNGAIIPVRIIQPSLSDIESNVNGQLLSPAAKEPSQSETARSAWSFASIKSVHDRGNTNEAIWKQKLCRLSHSASFPMINQHPMTVVNEPLTVNALSDALWKKSVRSKVGTKQKFLPLNKLEEIINPTSVKGVLESKGFTEDKMNRLVQGIFGSDLSSEHHSLPQKKGCQGCPGLYRIFALLIITNKVEAIEHFINHGINDSVLPLFLTTKEEENEENEDQDSGAEYEEEEPGSDADIQIRSRGIFDLDNDKLSQCFSSFSPTDVEHFCDMQRLVNVPFFSFPEEDSPVFFYDLDPACVLPIIKVGTPTSGGYGSVKKIVIHPAHHNYGSDKKDRLKIAFAVKKLHVQNDERFRKEVQNLERLSPKRKRHNPDHLVHLELVYKHGEDCCLVFPWASGNLKEYWEKHKGNPNNHDDITWFFKQCWGLALGLRRLHDPPSYAFAANNDIKTAEDILADAEYGRHGDIKPENILWFKEYHSDPNHLAICDFGSTEFNSLYSKSHVDAEGVHGYSMTYKPPDNHIETEVSQKFDIWSLGCVFLEFVSWFLLDYEQTVEDFPRKRAMPDPEFPNSIFTEDKFFYFEYSGSHSGAKSAKVKPAVIDWIRKIHKLESCPQSVHDFLDLIQFQMLVPNASERIDCKIVRVELDAIYKRCSKDPVYATAGCYYELPDPADAKLPAIFEGSETISNSSPLANALSQSKSRNLNDREKIKALDLDRLEEESSTQHHDIEFPELNEEMRNQKPLAEEFESYLDRSTRVPNTRRKLQSDIHNKYGAHIKEAKPSQLPTQSTNVTTGSSHFLSEPDTNDTTPYTTQPGDDFEEDLSKQPNDDISSDSREGLAIECPLSLPESRVSYVTEQHQVIIPNAGAPTVKDTGESGKVDQPPGDWTSGVTYSKEKHSLDPVPEEQMPSKPFKHRFQGIRDILDGISCRLRRSNKNGRSWKDSVPRKWKRYR